MKTYTCIRVEIELTKTLARQIEKAQDKLIVDLLKNEDVQKMVALPNGIELIPIIAKAVLCHIVEGRMTHDSYETDCAIQQVKETLQIPWEDLPLHINDKYPGDAVAAWRLNRQQRSRPNVQKHQHRKSRTRHRRRTLQQ